MATGTQRWFFPAAVLGAKMTNSPCQTQSVTQSSPNFTVQFCKCLCGDSFPWPLNFYEESLRGVGLFRRRVVARGNVPFTFLFNKYWLSIKLFLYRMSLECLLCALGAVLPTF